MSIKAKDLAKELGISTAAVSMALNGKPGVSTETRKRVLEAARTKGFDFTRLQQTSKVGGMIYFIRYRKHGAIINSSEFFDTMTKGLLDACKENDCKLTILELAYDEDIDEMSRELDQRIKTDCRGIILLGTEMRENDFIPFKNLNYPMVVLDTFIPAVSVDCILMNNVQGAFTATSYLAKTRRSIPGYLHSSYPIYNFGERHVGYLKAVREYGYSTANAIIHMLPPSMDEAYKEMLSIIDSGTPLAESYFADNDVIALGVIKALKERSYRVPEDISVIGFDNIPLCEYMEPPLSTMNVPVKYMARLALERLLKIKQDDLYYPVTTMVNTNIIKRKTTI